MLPQFAVFFSTLPLVTLNFSNNGRLPSERASQKASIPSFNRSRLFQVDCPVTLDTNFFQDGGGGMRGLSPLFIIKEILYRIQMKGRLNGMPLACDIFDLAGGTGTGG